MGGVSGKLVWVLLVMCSSWLIAAVHAQQAATTDPIEVAALEAILGRWGKTTSPLWRMSGEPCRGVPVDGSTDLDGNPKNNPGIKCDCSYNSGTVCHITQLRVYALNVVGQIPAELQNLTYLTYLNLDQNYLSGPIPSFIGQLTALTELHVGFNPLSGSLPKELGNLTNLNLLGISLTNFTGELPEELGNLSKLKYLGISLTNFSGQLPEELGNLTKLRQLYTDSAGLSGPFPSTLSRLKNLKLLRASDNNFTGTIPDFIGSLSNLEDLVLRNCKISGDLGAVDFLKFANLTFLFLGNNSLTGELPDGISPSLTNLDFSYNQLTGSFPSWVTQNNLQLNLVANNFILGSTNIGQLSPQHATSRAKLPPGRYSMFSWFSKIVSDNTMYELDSTNLGDSSYYVTSQTRWGVSNVGKLFQAPNDSKIIHSGEKIQNAVDSELFQTARMSPSSLRYYGLGLENGNYTVLLKFAELGFPDTPTWQSLGRRFFDIYIQGELKEKDFNIRKMAGGKSFTAVYKSYTTTVSKNFLEIHLFWAGKGTCCIPIQGYYGPLISALSITPNFSPTVRNGVPKKKSKAGAIVGIVIAASVLGSAILFGIFMVIKKRRRMAKQQEELYNLVGQPDVFSNAELKLATDNFSSQNILGEGGYGPVYKGVLPDGRVIAVKQLSQSSHQGKSQFVTEVATISAVQHRNLVKLHGCCIDSNTPLLVYEYLKNGSLDKALFGNGSIKLDWATRFEIILGIARGLTYLHEESSVRIVHRDIKASNVLLDTDLTPKISDFGLAKLYDEKKTHVSTGIAGTFGYLAPEYAMRRHLTEKVDVFAFGVVALEIVAGRSNTDNSLEESKIYLFEWAWSLYEKEQALGIVDPRLEEFSRDEVYRVIHVALICTQGSPYQRPPMSKVVAMLTGDVEVAEVVTKPNYITEWQFRGGNTSYVTSHSGSTTPELSRQKEIDPLTQSPTITGVSHEHEGRNQEMGGHVIVWILLSVCSWRISAAQAQQPPRTDPVEVAALEAILGRWNKTNSPVWSMSGEPCRGVPVDGVTGLDGNPKNNPGIKCDCSYINGTVCHITQLKVYALNVVGQIPAELQNLTYLNYLDLDQNYLSGPIPSFIGQLTALTELHVGFNALSGPIPKELGNLTNLNLLGISLTNFTGQLPEELGNLTKLQRLYTDSAGLSGPFPSTFSKLKNLKLLVLRNCRISGDLGAVDFSKFTKLAFLDFSYNQLTGSFPSWATQNNLQLNLVANNFDLGSTNNGILPPGLNCLQKDTPCLRDYSFAVDCGSNRSIRGSDNTMYELDFTDLGSSSYYVTSETRWGVSNVGKYFQSPNDSKIIYSNEKIQNAVVSELLQTARMSPSSLRYFGLGLENGNYTVLLQFAELGYPDSPTWKSLGRRVFDIYIQGDLKEKDFDIRKMAGGKSFTAVYKSYTATVSKNFLEIHLFWAGKGTCCIPIQGYYGPLISALSITPNFTPTVRNGVPKRKSKVGAIAGISIGASVVGLAALFGIFMFIKKRRRLAQQQGELYNLVGRPDVFSNAELKLATNNYSSQNILGEGGYGPVYKGMLPDGRVIAVKQLSQSSHQGKNQFVTEVATISSVQHRNLVKLHGKNSLKLDWATRFEIILGIARGLTYLHEESSVRIVHRDIKASNVLLDTDLTPKISDFGLARLYDEKKTHVSTGIAGTFGYLALEYAMRRHLTEKVDVYAFGVVALETVAGRSNTNNSIEESKIYLLEWAWDLYEKEQAQRIVDPRLEDFNKDEVLRVIHVALLCTQGSPNQRPPMSRVMAVLTGDAEVVEMVTKPSYITEWQYRDGNSTNSESTTSEFSRQKEIDPLTMSPTITGSSHDGSSSSVHGFLWLMLVYASCAAVQAQQAARTDPAEVAALNTILGRWGLRASPAWNISGEPCSGVAIDETGVDNNPNINPAIKCDCSFNAGTVCHIIRLRVFSLNVVGQIPEELQNLSYLNNLDLRRNYLTGPLPSFIGNFSAMQYLGISSNNFTGELPAELGNLEKLEQMYIISSGFSGPFPSTFSKLKNLKILWASDNDLTGKIPDYFGSFPNLQDLRIGDILNGSSSLSFISNLTSLNVLILRNCKISDNLGTVNFSKLAGDFSYNHLSGSFPPWVTGNNLQLNLVANDFILDSTNNSILPSGLNCLQQDTPCFRDYSFAVDCGSNKSTRGSDNTLYETDAQNIGAASYYVRDNARWGVSSVGKFNEASNGSYAIYSPQQFQSALNSELFQTARMSPSSLRYYGIGLENGNYTVSLEFAEFVYPNSLTSNSIGRRVFDIYVQGELKEKNFNIRKMAGGKSLIAVNKRYTATVSKNFLEIHLFWAGKGTCCIPTQGHYGPTISALSVTPNFIPTVRNGVPKKKSKAGTISGVVIGASFFGLAVLVGLFMLLKKRRRTSQRKEELYNMVGRRNVFSNAELKLATENFGSQNILGEGGYGPVYKGILTDGRVVAVKQLSQSSQQGKSQFVTEVATISSVQHRNLVKLYGCCIDSNTPLLVYEYLENGSLDQALFGDGRFNLGWSTRFEIILGIARGLSYLHEEANMRIVHRDIKASNILLDPDLKPKISDFGLAKLYDEKKTHVNTKVAGTFGYLAPEYAMRGHLTEKVDVFSFGVVALETVAGRSNTDYSLVEDKKYLFEWAWGLYEREQALGIVDPRLEEINEEEVLRVIRMSFLCTQGSPHQRPSMSRVVAMLTGDIPVSDVVAKPNYIIELQLRGRNSSHVTTGYSGSTADELSGQRETSPLTPSLEINREIIDDGR
uniref:non-specific serine/threonine protein kinase n=1 Tax=Oryza rufipogon TaxID=4529 RepID=A0A0E0QFK3_ORYRU